LQFNELMYTWSDMQLEVGVQAYDLMRQLETIAETYTATGFDEKKLAKLRQKEDRLRWGGV